MILAMMFGDLQLPPKTNMLLMIDATLSEIIAVFQGTVTQLEKSPN